MGSSIFGIGLSGLNAARVTLETTSNNISNVNTAGYHRQVASQAARMPQFDGYGFSGRGVDVTQVSRVYDRFLERQLSDATALSSNYQTQLDQVNQINNIVADTNAGLSPAVQDFFSKLQGLSGLPDNAAARQSVLDSGQALAGRIQSLGTRLNEMRSSVNGQIKASVDSINAISSQIANLNQRILSLGQGPDRQPNDLLDQRDQLVSQLNQYVKTDVLVQSDGSYNVSIGNGQGLVVGSQANQLTTVPSAADPEQLDIGYSFNGTVTTIPNKMIDGGKLGGLLNFREDSLNRAQADLGRLAINLADAMNRQHRLGRDQNNNPVSADVTDPNQGQFFKDLNSFMPLSTDPVATQIKKYRDAAASFAVVISDPTSIAVGSSLKATAGATNTGTAYVPSVWQVAGISDPSKTPDLSNFSTVAPVTLTYNSATQSFTAPAGLTVTASKDVAGGFQVSDGNGITFQMKLEGTPANGDTFAIDVRGTGPASADKASTNSNLLEMINLQTENTMTATPNGGATYTPAAGSAATTNFQGFYSQFVSYVGSNANQVQVAANAQKSTVLQIQQAQQSLSGVNLDEEAANLIKYQQAYQASSKVIQIAQQLFASVLQIGS